MQLKKFIKHLNNIVKENGDRVEVVMADSAPVVRPVFSGKYRKPSVIITDQE